MRYLPCPYFSQGSCSSGVSEMMLCFLFSENAVVPCGSQCTLLLGACHWTRGGSQLQDSVVIQPSSKTWRLGSRSNFQVKTSVMGIHGIQRRWQVLHCVGRIALPGGVGRNQEYPAAVGRSLGTLHMYTVWMHPVFLSLFCKSSAECGWKNGREC